MEVSGVEPVYAINRISSENPDIEEEVKKEDPVEIDLEQDFQDSEIGTRIDIIA